MHIYIIYIDTYKFTHTQTHKHIHKYIHTYTHTAHTHTQRLVYIKWLSLPCSHFRASG